MSPDDAHLLTAVVFGAGVGITFGLGMIDLRLRQIARALARPEPEVVGPDPEPIDDGWVSPPPEAETVRAVSPTPNRAWPFASDPEGARLRAKGGYPSGAASPSPVPPPPPPYLPGHGDDRASGALGR